MHFLQQAAVSTTSSVVVLPSPQDNAALDRNSTSIRSSTDSPVSQTGTAGAVDPSSRFSTSVDPSSRFSTSVDPPSRFSAPLITVESMRQMIEDSMPGVFTATLKVMIDVDEQPAVECISLDQSLVNLLTCFAKCYGKGQAQNRRGIIQFATSKVSRFRTFVTLRFSIASRSLSYISRPLSLCNDPNFW